jgi:hypothetical protein
MTPLSFFVTVTISACNFLMTGHDGKPVCRNFELPRFEVDHKPTPMECMMNSQIAAMRWKQGPPSFENWQINKIKCTFTNDKAHVENGI